ncbi:sensor domain-containing diguanylate cyclase [Herbaspirillum sp. RTI4]|uniref:sensor domain-containing diguanylate cyclase n=1 Tax=Herbaspirillum sp. RTI4 TaxID=3048640 RepID=UPI002AB3D129|nr:sensor domain-containing diguanylate cyclase [Herbaspirillum sp. RTI4]MDY7577719.1 sensor domain-containing diguanylate cyclase [Herbaspirillum sp. RTI4]MEA9980853.1 sensor domain-containing diguanylate cyclase [Herbaspirillum sp. RTI4]
MEPSHAADLSAMNEDLLDENHRLHAEMQELLKLAHTNQQIMHKHQAFDLSLIGSGSFRELIEAISQTMPHTFQLEAVTLTLIDADYDIRHILDDLKIGLREFPHLLFRQAPLPDDKSGPELGTYDSQRHRPMFPLYVPASVAILPLSRQHKLIGYLALGSAHETRFASHLATDFIERLASIVAICLENVINSERLKHIGLTDPLTGISNRRYIEQRLQEELARAQRERSGLACLFMDIDHFKRINDQFGHHSGDQVLCEVANRIKKELRLSDSFARFGGEEFVVLLNQATMADAMRIGERIRLSIASRNMEISGFAPVSVTISGGAAAVIAPDRSVSAEALKQQLLARADQALYRAKHTGRNRLIAAEGLHDNHPSAPAGTASS